MAFVLVFILGCFIGACAMLAAAMYLATAPDRERPDWSDGHLGFSVAGDKPGPYED